MATTKPDDKATKATTPTKAAGDDAKATEYEGGPVLVFNARLGPYVCNHVQQRKDLPVGVGKDDPRQRMDITRIAIPPGLFLLTAEQFAKCAPNDGFQSRIRQHALVVLNDDPEISWDDEWAELRAKRCLDYIADSGHPDTLKALLEVEERDEVADALQRQLDSVVDEGKARQNARSAQRAHNRGQAKRRGRVGRMLR